MEVVTREVFWGVPHEVQSLFYMAAAFSVLIFLYGLWKRTSVWTLGKRGGKFEGYRTRDFLLYSIKSLFGRDCILAKRSFALTSYRGFMLFFIIWGFLTLFLGTILLTIHHYFIHFLEGSIYLIYSLLLDLAGALFLIGLVIAIGRRHLLSEVRKNTSMEDMLFLYAFLLIVVTGFAVEGMRLLTLQPVNMDYAVIGGLSARILSALGVRDAGSYMLIWWAHVTAVLVLIAVLPYTKFFHVFSSQITTAAAQKRYGGAKGDSGH